MGVRRQSLSINFSGEALRTIEAIAVRRNTTIAEEVRHAIGLYGWFRDHEAVGGRLFVRLPGGEERELIAIDNEKDVA